MFEMTPDTRLAPDARYEVWWEDEDNPTRSDIIGTFRVQTAEDNTPPVWSAPTAHFRKARKNIVDMCGTPERLLMIEGGFARDEATRHRLFYAVTFTQGATTPDALFPSRELLAVDGPDEDPGHPWSNIQLAEQSQDDSEEGCLEHMVRFPKGSTLHATIKAIDFSGNSTPSFEFDAK